MGLSRWGAAIWAACAISGSVAARESITWMTADLPPAAIFEGELAGNGFSDQQLNVLAAALPDYDHHIVKGTIARDWHELETRDGVCFNWVTRNPGQHRNASFSKRPVLNPGYRLVVKAGRLTEFLPYIASGKADLDLLGRDGTMSGAVAASRDYLPALDAFIESRDRKAHLQKTINNSQLIDLLHAERVDFIVASPTEVAFYKQTLRLKDDYSLIKVRNTPPYNEAYIACSAGHLGREVLAKIDAYLSTPAGWAAYVAPLKPWLDPADFAFAAGTKPR